MDGVMGELFGLDDDMPDDLEDEGDDIVDIADVEAPDSD